VGRKQNSSRFPEAENKYEKVQFALEQAMKAQMESGGTALLFL
jgi:hypothetical protein